MQFTPQQLTGGPKYQHCTRIGNWSEDIEIEDIKLKDYLKKKETGSLIVTSKQKQLEESLVPCELSASEDGFLKFGQKVMLFNHQSMGFISANPYDTVVKQYEAWALTSSTSQTACARNVFEVERADDDDGFEGNELHYGQKFRLRMEPFSRIGGPAWMHSEMVTSLAAAKFSRHQEVTVLAAPSGETLWQFLYPDTTMRFEMDGEPVPAGSPLVVRHVHTGSFLASDEIPYQNLFGQENEVHCFHYYSLSKSQNLTSEKKGDITGEHQLRKHGLPNIWSVVTATHAVGSQATSPEP